MLKELLNIHPRNVLYLSTFGNLRWGGQKSLYNLVTRLDKHKYRPYVLLPTDEDFAEALRLKDIPVIIRSLPRIKTINPILILSTIRFLMKFIDDFAISLIHTDGPRNTFYAGIAAKFKHRPLVWHVRSSDKDCCDILLVPLCTKIILVANALRSRFNLAKNDKIFTTIYNGVDLREFHETVPSNSNIRSNHKVDKDLILIGSFARIEPMKGQQHLIQTCAMLKSSFRFKLLLFGEVCDQNYYHKCLQTIDELGLKENVVFGNHQNDVSSILKEIDFVVLNSLGEAFPRSVIEAMAAAKPVIATDVGGCAEAVENGVSGFIVPAEDAIALADVLIKLGKNKQLRYDVGKAARTRAEKLFTIEENIRKTERIYNKLLSRGENA